MPGLPDRHIIIVGGGVIGVSTAYYLSRHTAFTASKGNIRVTIVEGSEIAAGASGKAGGFLARDFLPIVGTLEPSSADLAKLSYNLHASLAAEHSGEEKWGYRQLDTLNVAADFRIATNGASNRAKSSAKLCTDSSIEGCHWLDKSIFTETSWMGKKETTSQVHPFLFTNSLASLAEERGVKIVFAMVETISRREAGGFKIGIKDRDSGLLSNLIGTDLVLASGPWTGELLKKIDSIVDEGEGAEKDGEREEDEGGKLFGGRARNITGGRIHSVVMRSAEDRQLPAQALFTKIKTKGDAVEPEIYNRPDGTAYVCGTIDTLVPLPRLASEVTTNPEIIAALISQAGLLSPNYLTESSGAVVEKRQACYLPMGSGDLVICKVNEEEGIYVASGHYEWGICNGPGTGLCMAELILDGKVTSANIDGLGL